MTTEFYQRLYLEDKLCCLRQAHRLTYKIYVIVPKNHFLQLPLQNEKEVKTVDVDQDEEQVAASSNYSDVLETCLSPVSVSKATSVATIA